MIAAAQKMIHSHRWAARFDDGRHWRARIGFVLIATERNIEHEMIRLAPAGVGMHFSRAPDVALTPIEPSTFTNSASRS